MFGEPVMIERGRGLLDEHHLVLVVRPVGADDHCRRYVGGLQMLDSDPPSTVVVDGLGDQLARDRVGLRGFQPRGCVIHDSHLDPSAVRA
ncbi:hypothetical protein AB0L88_09485 [Saccharopolyspora shandongensis]|uniref:hypothetical protein n=1 Tax=Saccharopolyspora shandongensis TaxID=418495 RepID=UPI003426539B